MVDDFFSEVTGPIPFGGLESTDPLSFKVYEPDRLVLGKRMEDHLRPGVCFWHSFAWAGVDMFGVGTMDRPWLDGTTDEMAAARTKMAAAFEFFTKLGIPYYCFHDRDVAPEGASFATFRSNLDALADDAAGYQERTGVRLLWGTANLFTHPRYQAGAATNPDPEVFAYAAAQVKHMLEIDQAPRRRELRPVGWPRGLRHAAQHGPPTRRRPARPVPAPRRRAQAPDRLRGPAPHRTKADGAHQAPVRLRRRDGPRLPRQARARARVRASTSRPTTRRSRVTASITRWPTRSRTASSGSIDANRGDPQNGWDTDQFPNSVDDLALPLYEILQHGGIAPGGFNFDAKLRRQSTRPDGPVPRPHRRPRYARPGAPGRGRPRRARRARRSQGATLRGLGRPARHRDPRRQRNARVASRRGRGRRRSTRDRHRATRSCSRTSSTSRSGLSTRHG